MIRLLLELTRIICGVRAVVDTTIKLSSNKNKVIKIFIFVSLSIEMLATIVF